MAKDTIFMEAVEKHLEACMEASRAVGRPITMELRCLALLTILERFRALSEDGLRNIEIVAKELNLNLEMIKDWEKLN